MSAIEMGLSPKSREQLYRTLGYLRLPEQTRKQVMQKVLWRMKDNAKRNVANQRTPDGQAWTPRKRAKSGGIRANKMLKKRAVYLKSKLKNEGKGGRLFYENDKSAEISALHQYGLAVKVEQSEKEKKEQAALLAMNHKQATPKQIKRLIDLGYLKGRKGSYKTLRESMSMGQAGLIIRLMEQKQGIRVRRGLASYKMPARPFLDEDERRNADIITEELLKGFAQCGIHLTS